MSLNRGPASWLLAAVLLGAILFGYDATRPPHQQALVRAYALAVDAHHGWIHPLTARYVRCRFTPSCSNYSVEAVRRYGIAHGLILTVRRIARCQPGVVFGTSDPVP